MIIYDLFYYVSFYYPLIVSGYGELVPGHIAYLPQKVMCKMATFRRVLYCRVGNTADSAPAVLHLNRM